MNKAIHWVILVGALVDCRSRHSHTDAGYAATKPDKLESARRILGGKRADGSQPSVYVHFDARRSDVQVPTYLKTEADLVLQVGYDMPIPIPDLVIDKSGVSGTLSFHGAPSFCRVPWPAVFALVGDDGRFYTWPEDRPESVDAGLRGATDL
jgi:hypothetical protein